MISKCRPRNSADRLTLIALNLTPPPARLPVCDTTNQAKLIGILYHENNLTPHVFTS
jgi:hypothetical protein